MQKKIFKVRYFERTLSESRLEQNVSTIALTVHGKSCMLFQFKKIRNLFWLMQVFVINLPSTKKKKRF